MYVCMYVNEKIETFDKGAERRPWWKIFVAFADFGILKYWDQQLLAVNLLWKSY